MKRTMTNFWILLITIGVLGIGGVALLEHYLGIDIVFFVFTTIVAFIGGYIMISNIIKYKPQ